MHKRLQRVLGTIFCVLGLGLALFGFDGAWRAYGQTAGPTPTPDFDLPITKAVSPSNALPGDTVTFSINVTNDQPQAQTNVVLTDSVVNFLEVVAASSSKGTASFSGQTVRADVGTLASGESVTLTITTRVRADTAAGTIGQNVAFVNTASGSSSSSNVVTVTIGGDGTPTPSPTPLPVGPKLVVEKSASPASGKVGDLITFKIVVRNTGGSTAPNVVVNDRILDFLEVVSVQTSKGSATTTGQAVKVTVGDLAAGESVTIAITTKIRAGTSSGQQGINIAEAVASDGSGGSSSTPSNPVAIAVDRSAPVGLPDTSAPNQASWIFWLGLGLAITGGLLLMVSRRRSVA